MCYIVVNLSLSTGSLHRDMQEALPAQKKFPIVFFTCHRLQA